ncbi:hypothetical protein IV102_12330 [bacterium]|nr:hypothetical protein [bacterium]
MSVASEVSPTLLADTTSISLDLLRTQLQPEVFPAEVRPTPDPPTPTNRPAVAANLPLEAGLVGNGLVSTQPGPTCSSQEVVTNTLGWSGEPAAQAPFQQSHRQQIHAGLGLMEEVMPGMQAKMDQLLHQPDPLLQGKLDALVSEQNHLLASQGKLLSMPDERLNPKQVQQKARLNARIAELSQSYDATEKQLDDKKAANIKQAGQLADAFLGRLRKRARTPDVSDRVKLDDSARQRLAEGGIDVSTVHHWVNEFHHQTGLPAPRQLKFRYSEKRPNYNSQVDSVNIGDKFSKRLTLHEVAHRVEYKYPEISLANKSWVKARCEKGGFSDEPVRLSQLVPKDLYKEDEVALEDTFVNPYVGKVYPDMATEVLSMGLEHFSSPELLTKLYQRDPEHVFLTLGAIKTMQGKSDW